MVEATGSHPLDPMASSHQSSAQPLNKEELPLR